MRKFSYALFGILALAAVGVGSYAYLNRPTSSKSVATTIEISPRVAITNRSANAFGNFSSNPAATTSVPQGEALGLGGGSPSKMTTDSASKLSPGVPVTPTTYEYVYTGEPLAIPDASVLKRTNQLPNSTLETVLKSANLGLIDLEKFSNLKVQQIALAEDRDQGYSVSIDLSTGSIGLYQNWARWTLPVRDAVQNVNTESMTLPSDEQVVTMTNAFLDKYGIPRSAYGAPVVSKGFMGYGKETLQIAPLYIQSLEVVYPLVINGKPVVSENGYPFGLSVVIELSSNRVASVSNLTGLSYESSAYPLLKDTATVLDVVKRGGMYGSKPVDANVKKVRVEVGTPTVGYMFSSYQLDSGSSDVLVPALIFPITKVPTGTQVYSKTIVVPLVQELIEPQIIQPLTSGGSAGSVTGVQVDAPQTTVKE